MVDLDVLKEEGGRAAFIRLAGSGAVLPRAGLGCARPPKGAGPSLEESY